MAHTYGFELIEFARQGGAQNYNFFDGGTLTKS